MIFNVFKRKPHGAPSDTQAESFDAFSYQAIPRRSVNAAAVEAYPQERTAARALSLTVLRDRYAEQMHAALDNLPLADAEIDAYVIPVLLRVIHQIHLLPASEMHHHWGWGGLLVHSLEVARYAVEMAERELFDENTQSQRYQNRPRWACACCIMGLIHDVGKCHDISVSTEDGQEWNCLHEPLMNWFSRHNLNEYRIEWRKGRIHKSHEGKSLRMAYLRLLPDETIRYLTEVTGPNILDAIDAAIVGRDGRLTHILKEAEARSIAADAEQRKCDAIAQTDPAKFLSRAVLQAIQGLITTGTWQPNGRDCPVVYDGKCLFLEACAYAGQMIREFALGQGNKFVPQNIDAQIEFLESAGALVPHAKDELLWMLESVNGIPFDKPKPCVCIATVADMPLAEQQPAVLGWKSAQQKTDKKVSFAAPKTLLERTNPPSGPSQNNHEHEEKSALPNPPDPKTCDKPLNPHECQELVTRVVLQAQSELLNGGGILIPKVVTGSDGERIGSSFGVEQYLKSFGIDVVTSKTLLKANASLFKVVFDSDKHQLVVPNSSNPKGYEDHDSKTQL